ncbi:hypothetical protein SAMN05216548_10887 [Faunimonas pinastri]|uniref:4-aminobutyrate aminotransferase n=1 Tax=Faunimonas pinastri TaxID=1855383 RepID=A0A1H9JE08_9HYPH|nr:hypothetical protein [Faunimonas pinastri]SEQ84969.1 hypothetical protein SAMN05216548_10887 [Faunimonas pinastri]
MPKTLLRLALASASLAAFLGTASAQQQVVQDHFQTSAGKPVRVGVFALLGPNCTPAELKIGMPAVPHHGTVTLQQGKVHGSAAAKCPNVDLKGYSATYKPSAGFSGTDEMTIEVRAPSGQTQQHKVTVQVAP